MTSKFRLVSASNRRLERYAIQIPVNVKLQQIGRVITWSAGFFGLNSTKASFLQIELLDESINEAYRVVRTNVVIDRGG